MTVRRWLAISAVLTLATVLAACGGGDDGTTGSTGAGTAGQKVELSLVAYSTPQEAYDQLTEAFAKTPEGAGVSFTKSYGASGEQSRAVESGLAADVVAFSLEPDMTRLVKAGLVAEDWNADEHKGLVTKSVVALIVKKGNPDGIKDWADLTKDGIEVITPNPFTSGGARWNVMAAYGQAVAGGKAEADGVAYLQKLFANVAVQDDTARKSLQTFTSGKGDVLLGYENEAIFAQQKGQAIDYVLPDATILIENPAAVTATSKHPEKARAFLDFLRTPEAQAIFAKNGYRPVIDADVDSPYEFPEPSGLFTIAEFGGWADVTAKFFDPAKGIMADVERGIGVSVG